MKIVVTCFANLVESVTRAHTSARAGKLSNQLRSISIMSHLLHC